MTLIPTTRMRTRTVIPTMSRGVNKVPFDEYMLLLFPYVVTLPYVSSLAFYVRRVQMYRGFNL
jgi:hypothetical protein